MKDKWEIYPGSIFPNVIENYDPSLKVKHVLFLSPFCWEGKLSSFFYRERKEIFLQAVPITQAELDFAIEHGTDILEEKLLSQAKSIFSLGRNSVIL
jgi:hypothetical protein